MLSFCTITSMFWQLCRQTGLNYNFRFPIFNKTHDRHTSKSFNQEFYSINEVSRLAIDGNTWSRLIRKSNTWYIHNFLKIVGNNNIFPIKTVVIVSFWDFNNNMISVITISVFSPFHA